MKIRKKGLFGFLALIFWAPIPWLYFGKTKLLAGHPLAIYAFVLFICGLSSAGLSLYYFLKGRRTSISARIYALIFVFIGIGVYQLSPFAPNWNCFGKQIYVATANAAGQNCKTTCTNWDAKPCSGWSSCYNKIASCNSSGIDQDGRSCQGCCFSCKVVCDPEPDPDQPPTITASISCSQNGNNGWCTGDSVLNMVASDPQGYTLTISGSIGGTAFTCPPGKTCSQTLPNGTGAINYRVTASQSGKSASGSTSWKRDAVPPVIVPNIPSTTGSNGWFNMIPVPVSASGSDTFSGFSDVKISVNGGAWQPDASLNSDGEYTIDFEAVDNAGNVATLTRTISVDVTPPSLSAITSGTLGNAGWYVSNTSTTVSSTDALAGADHVEFDQNGAGWQNGSSIPSSDGDNVISIRVYDIAGNVATEMVNIKVDTLPPVITPSIAGKSGLNGWLVSPGTVSAVVNDATSGVDGEVDVSFDNGSTWQNTPVTLNDGVYDMIFRAFDIAGNEGRTTFAASIDTTIPDLGFAFIGAPGESGWYVSDVDVSANASDALSGLDSFEIRADDELWSTKETLSDGIHKLEARAADKAGNFHSISGTLYVDTHTPQSTFKSHTNNDVVTGKVTLSGEAEDLPFGVSFSEISLDGGATWQRTNLSDGMWSFDWDTSNLPNGSYTVQVRAIDAAGNKENPIALTLIASNFPPYVKITDSWWIWESGFFNVSTNIFAIAEIKVTISDPQNRWKSVEFEYSPKVTSSPITWDRHFGDVIAPSGNYHATILACDIYGNCANKRGVIRIPIIAPIPPLATPSPVPTFVPTMTILPSGTGTPAPQANPTQTPRAIVIQQTDQVVPERNVSANHSFWVVAFITMLVLLFGTTSLLDPRPKALRSLARTIDQFNTRKSFYDKE